MKGLLGKKLGMTQVFTTDGILIPVTVVEVQPNVVLQKKTKTTDGYTAVQLGAFDQKSQRSNKPHIGHVTKANAQPKQFVREIRSDVMAEQFEVGSEVKVDLFSAGDKVDVTGTSKGKGFMGAIYRHNYATGPNSHGSGYHRGQGSLATIGRNNGIVNKGKGMAGHEGFLTTTNQNLEIIKVDVENNALLIKGNVPGPKRGYVIVKTTVKANKATTAKDLLDRTAVVETPVVDEAPVVEDVVEPIVEEGVETAPASAEVEASMDASPEPGVEEVAAEAPAVEAPVAEAASEDAKED